MFFPSSKIAANHRPRPRRTLTDAWTFSGRTLAQFWDAPEQIGHAIIIN
jgi:hypothetical protein